MEIGQLIRLLRSHVRKRQATAWLGTRYQYQETHGTVSRFSSMLLLLRRLCDGLFDSFDFFIQVEFER